MLNVVALFEESTLDLNKFYHFLPDSNLWVDVHHGRKRFWTEAAQKFHSRQCKKSIEFCPGENGSSMPFCLKPLD
jgi:hypothetical protein